MFTERFSRRLAPALLCLALTLPLAAATPELDRLAGEVEAFALSGAADGATSLKLSAQLGWSLEFASFEKDAGRRAELTGRLESLRERLAGAGRRVAARADSSETILIEGVVTGIVTHDGAPVAGAVVAIYSPQGLYRGGVATGADGKYSVLLPQGPLVLYVEPPFDSPLSPQLYSGINCFLLSTCDFADATQLVLSSGGHLTADFALVDLGHIEGHVRNRDTLQPFESLVTIFSSGGVFMGSDQTSPDGAYVFAGLAPGDYYVMAVGGGDRAGMLYHDVPCNMLEFNFKLGCPLQSGTKVTVALEQVVAGIDFDLYRGAAFTGRVVDAQTGLPVFGRIDLRLPDFDQADSVYNNGVTGEFRIEGLAPGRYYLYSEVEDYTVQFYDHFNCTFEERCLAGARPIDALLGTTYGGLDFALAEFGTLTGRVTDDRTGAAIDHAWVEISARGSNLISQGGYTDSSGFFSFSGLPALEMVLLASHQSYAAEYFDDVPAILGRGAATGVLIQPGQIVSGIEMKLAKRGGITGRVFTAGTGLPTGCSYRLYPVADLAGEIGSSCVAEGVLQIPELAPGLYYLQLEGINRARYLYGKGSCNLTPTSNQHCNLQEGFPVEVRSGEDTVLSDIFFEFSGSITSLVRFEPPQNFAPPGGFLRLFESDGDEVHSVPLLFALSERTFRDLAPGDYRVLLEGGPTWQSFAWPAEPCGRWYCDPQSGGEIHLEAGEAITGVDFTLAPIVPYAGCTPSETALCLNEGRYEVTAIWRDFGGASGAATARGLTADTGYFYFFSPSNLEVMVKVLNACDERLGHHFWVYGAGLTDVEVEMRVRDTVSEAVRTYTNLLGNTFQPILDSSAFATCDAPDPLPETPVALAAALEVVPAVSPPAAPAADAEAVEGADYCEEDPFSLCLGGRFRVSAFFQLSPFTPSVAVGRPITRDTGAFSFFSPTNLELIVKVLDACSSGLPGHWVFISGLTDVAVDITVQDLATGSIKLYRQAPGPFKPVLDLGSFPCN